ncbi:MAG TPA: homoserine kinase [Gemmatimonadaceae bacterium]|nr:homoserine kinase [Gemmatimonadaceae bacterium]
MTARALVRVPASTSNVGAGFDCVGIAVDQWLTVSATFDVERDAPPVVERGGTIAALDVAAGVDRIVTGFRAACAYAGRDARGALAVRASSRIPVARGLGSSAAATVAGVAIANALVRLGLDHATVAAIAAQVEGHPDNVAAAVFGGATLAVWTRDPAHAASATSNGARATIASGWTDERGGGLTHRSRDGELVVSELPVAEDVALVLAVPDFTVRTADARARLPREVPHATAVRAASLAAALVRGLATGDGTLLSLALDDVLHVPHRRSLVPGIDAVCAAARAAGAFGVTLSGSGSALLALAPRARAEHVSDVMRESWAVAGVESQAFVSMPRVEGHSVLIRRDCEPGETDIASRVEGE